jgi:hypothetical protein
MTRYGRGQQVIPLVIAMIGAAYAQTPVASAGSAAGTTPGLQPSTEIFARFEDWKHSLPQGTGRFKVIREEPIALKEHTVFRPARLPAYRLPVVAFANGGCRNTPIEFTAFLAEMASHGYVIVAAGTDDVDFAVKDFLKTMPDGKPLEREDASVLTSAVDWALTENSRPASPYFGKLDPNAVAYVGQSCGGMQALGASMDTRTKTTVVLNSANLPSDFTPNGLTIRLPARVNLNDLHAPVAYFIGGPADMMYGYAEANYKDIKNVPVFMGNLPVGHTGAYPGPDLRWSRAVIGWLDWRLKGDLQARKMFTGSRCGLCVSGDWAVESKNMISQKEGEGMPKSSSGE